MTTSRLTEKQKRNWLPRLKVEYGDKCFYCKEPFNHKTHKHNGLRNPHFMVFDHLNNKEYDNRIENIVLCHNLCNQRKKNNADWQIIAKDQLKENESGVFVREREKQTKNEKPDYGEIADHQNIEIESNARFFYITRDYLNEELKNKDKIALSETLDSIAMMCMTELGHGSQTTIRKHVGMLTSKKGSFELVTIAGTKWIVKGNPITELTNA